MPKTLILVRHGKAEPSSPATPDEARELTSEGRRALAAPSGFPRTFSLLSDEERADAVIWASTAVRAHETAEEVVRAIGDRAIWPHATLWEQDGQGFLSELARSSADCVIAVGHIPFVDEIASYLTGAALEFKPGSAAAIELDPSLALGSSKLSWFVQGPRA